MLKSKPKNLNFYVKRLGNQYLFILAKVIGLIK